MAVGSLAVGKRASRSCRSEERPVASARSAPTVSLLRVPAGRRWRRRSARAGRRGRRRPGSARRCRCASGLLLVTCSSRSVQLSFFSGQPNRVATGSGIATTTGLRAMDAPLAGANAVASVLQPQQPGRGVRHPDVRGDRGAAGLADAGQGGAVLGGHRGGDVDRFGGGDVTLMQVPPTAAPSFTHWDAAASTAGASSVATATESWISPEQDGLDQLLVAEPDPGRDDENRRHSRRRLLAWSFERMRWRPADTLTILRIRWGHCHNRSDESYARRNS